MQETTALVKNVVTKILPWCKSKKITLTANCRSHRARPARSGNDHLLVVEHDSTGLARLLDLQSGYTNHSTMRNHAQCSGNAISTASAGFSQSGVHQRRVQLTKLAPCDFRATHAGRMEKKSVPHCCCLSPPGQRILQRLENASWAITKFMKGDTRSHDSMKGAEYCSECI